MATPKPAPPKNEFGDDLRHITQGREQHEKEDDCAVSQRSQKAKHKLDEEAQVRPSPSGRWHVAIGRRGPISWQRRAI